MIARILAAVGFAASTVAAQQEVVFRSDVSLVRVDVEALDGARAIGGLAASDFVLKENGRVWPIRNFSQEELPVDVLILLDVSGSMRPHVERVANASAQALNVLAEGDRVALMVFDRNIRVRMAFEDNRLEIQRAFDRLVREERFNGGTDVTKALVMAADYIGKTARREARKAIVVMTDDMTEFERDEPRVLQALLRADAVLSALIAPDAMGNFRLPGGAPGGGSWPGGGWPGSGWPGGGGGWPGSRRGPVVLGPTSGGGGVRMGRPHPAGTPEIARDSGGDSLPVDRASSLEEMLQRIRQRYALHFALPPGLKAGVERPVSVELTAAAMRRYPGATLRYRNTYLVNADSGDSTPAEVVTVLGDPGSNPPPATTQPESTVPAKRRPAVAEPRSTRGPNPKIL